MAVIALLLVIGASAFTPKNSVDLNKISLIPRPVSIYFTGNVFTLTYSTGIFYQEESPSLRKSALFLADILRPSTGFPVPVIADKKKPHGSSIYLTLTDNTDL